MDPTECCQQQLAEDKSSESTVISHSDVFRLRSAIVEIVEELKLRKVHMFCFISV